MNNMRLNSLRFGWLLGALLLVARPWATQGFVSYVTANGQPQKWNLTTFPTAVRTNVVNRATRAVRYFLASDGYSTANLTAELNAARACFDQWQSVPGSILRFEEGGLLTGNVQVNTADNTNVVYWAKRSTIVNGGHDSISGLTGVTYSDFFSDGTLAEADIVLNGVEYSWFTDFNNHVNQAQFVESGLLHEIGHFIGLAHSPIGAATLFARGGGGVNVLAGLSSDEIAAVHALYPDTATPATVARLTGQVTLRGAPVLGAVITLEDSAGNVAAGTVTRADGHFDQPGLAPGQYQVRVTPLDPGNANYFLFRGADIEPGFAAAEVNFLPTVNTPAKLVAGGTTTLNFSVTGGTPSLRIGQIWPPTTTPSIYVVAGYAVAVPAGASDVVMGVYSSDLPGADPVLRMTGDGLTFGATTVVPNVFEGAPLNLISVPVHIAPNATPGMRSLVYQQGGTVAYANGFVEISPSIPDYNFDGLDDRFQRQYFPRWTAPEAGPNANPDGDRDTNAQEYIAGTNPTDSNSLLRVESVRLDAAGATVAWPSAPGKRYQVFSRPQVNSLRGWVLVGSPVVSTGNRTEFLDTTASGTVRFYRIQALP